MDNHVEFIVNLTHTDVLQLYLEKLKTDDPDLLKRFANMDVVVKYQAANTYGGADTKEAKVIITAKPKPQPKLTNGTF